MEQSCVIADNFRAIILELNYICPKGQVIVLDYIAKVIVLDYIAKVIVLDYIAKVIVIDYIAKVIVIDYIAKVIVIMITAATAFLAYVCFAGPSTMQAAFLFVLYLIHAPRVYFNSI